VEWFNWIQGAALRIEYEGPEQALQAVASAALWRRIPGQGGAQTFSPGIDYRTYLGPEWTSLPDFEECQPVGTGIATNFDIRLRPRDEHVGMVFEGFLESARAGVYTFYVEADDGARLWVGDASKQCTVSILSRPVVRVATRRLAPGASMAAGDHQWTEVEGEVRFASRRGHELELEVLTKNGLVPVSVVEAGSLGATNLLRQQVRATGICEVGRGLEQPGPARLIVLGAQDVENLSLEQGTDREDLTAAEQVRSLQPVEARKSLHAKLRGVVTMATHWSFVLQDGTGGVFVEYAARNWIDQPRAGENWEVEGTTDPGQFSPMIRAQRAWCLGSGAFPEPIHPTWEQLMNGSADAEWIEIQGVITRWGDTGMELLTRDGKITVLAKDHYFLPELPVGIRTSGELLGSLVRIRGVFTASWDLNTLRFRPGEFYLGNATLCVDEMPPKDPFSIATRRATDPLLFTSHLGALTRLKLAGQVLYASPGECLLLDGSSGVRVITPTPAAVQENDLVEAVGFPQLGGPSAVLLEGVVQKVGRAERPQPTVVLAGNLTDRSLDATPVRVEAVLLSDVVRQGERVLELRAGPQHFLARLASGPALGRLMRRDSRVRLTGVYSARPLDRSVTDLDSFELLLSHPEDIVVLQPGPWWTVRHTIATIVVLLSGLVAALVWITSLRRTVAQRTTELKREIEERQTIEHRRAMEQERSRVAQDLHDDLGAGLAQIGWVGALAQRASTSPERAREYLAEITNKSNAMVSALDEIVWAINPKHDSTTAVSGYLCDYAQEFLQPTGIACRFDVGRDGALVALNSQQRHQLFLAFREALTNVVKHAQATEVWIRIGSENGDLRVVVEDNGRGLAINGHRSNGDGMSNMRERLKQIAGRCEIEARTGGGTVVRFRIGLEQRVTE